MAKLRRPLCGFLCALALLGSAASAWWSRSLVMHGVRTIGVVQISPNSAHPEITFETASGKTFALVTDHRSKTVGDTFPVVYDPDNPGGTATIDSPLWLWGMPFVLFAAGSFALLAALPVTELRAVTREGPTTPPPAPGSR